MTAGKPGLFSGRWYWVWLVAAATVLMGSHCGKIDVPIPDIPPPFDPLRIQQVSPPGGPAAGGTTITISGQGFTTNTVATIGGVAVVNQNITGTHTIICDTPAGSAGGADVVVTRGQVSQTEIAGFTYDTPTPTVTSVTPLWGALGGGTTVTILGSGFRLGATVSIGGAPATSVTVLSGGRLTAVTPSGTAGPAGVSVTTPGPLTGTLTNGFFYDAPPPTLTSISPTSGPGTGGTLITLTGTGFFAGASVTVGGVASPGVTVTSSTSATAVTPDVSFATGGQDVVFANVDTDSATLLAAFTPTVVGGALDGGFGINGVAYRGAFGYAARDAVQDGTHLYLVGDSDKPDEWRLSKVQLSDGARASFFGPNSPGGTITWSTGPHDNEALAAVLLGTDVVVVGRDHASSATAANTQWRLESRQTGNGNAGFQIGNPAVYTTDPSVGADAPVAVVTDTSSLFIAGTDAGATAWRIVKRSATNGTLDTGFGTGGVLTSNTGTAFSSPCAMVHDGTYLYIFGTVDLGGGDSEWRVEKRSMSTGALDTGFGTNGVRAVNPSSGLDPAADLAADGTDLYLVGHDDSPGNHQWRIHAVTMSNGSDVTSFGTNGVVTVNPSSGADGPAAVAADGTALYVLGYDEAPGDRQWRIEKRSLSSGARVAGFGNGGVIVSNRGPGADYPTALVVTATHLYLTGSDWRIEKRTK